MEDVASNEELQNNTSPDELQEEIKIYDFKNGELIVPEDNLAEAFRYSEVITKLWPNINYRKANSAETIFFEKKIKPNIEKITTIDKYKQSKSSVIGSIHKSYRESRYKLP